MSDRQHHHGHIAKQAAAAAAALAAGGQPPPHAPPMAAAPAAPILPPLPPSTASSHSSLPTIPSSPLAAKEETVAASAAAAAAAATAHPPRPPSSLAAAAHTHAPLPHKPLPPSAPPPTLQRWNSSTGAAASAVLAPPSALPAAPLCPAVTQAHAAAPLPITTTSSGSAANGPIPPLNPHAPPPLPASVFSASAADLAARATSMQDCPLDSRDGRTERLFHFPSSVPFDSKAWKAASQAFEDPELTSSCDEGLNKQLRRTKDGATEQSRIQELAGLVKVLRKNVRELGSRTSGYVDQCIKLERELVQQIETVQLSSECAIKTLEAELAGTKSSLAGFEASFKADKASWGAELEGAKYEGNRLKRELERVTEERDRAREEGKRAEQLRQQLELELKELRKAASQQMREVAVSQSEAVRMINDEKVAAERREAHLKEDNSRLGQRLEAASACVEALQHELAVLQQLHDKAKDGLQSKTGSEEVAVQRAAQLQSELTSCQALLAALEGEVAALRQQLDSADTRRVALEQELNEAKASLQVDFVAGQQAAADERAAASDAALAAARTELSHVQQEVGGKDERLAVLEGEFAALKEVLGDAGGQRDVVQSLLSRISSLQTAVATADSTRRKMHNELVSIRGNVFSTVSELVQSALDGYHVCLFSYGQTGAGKTYTMQGGPSPEQRGIIPRSVEKILDTAHKLREQDWEYNMEASFVEVYNNSLRDLLGGPSAPFINDQSAIKHDSNGGHTHVAGVSRVAVPDMEAAEHTHTHTHTHRACESTAMNSESSRSHVVFMLYIHGVHPPSGTDLQGCLCLVDLAGSERLDRSQAEDARKKEACAINQSLSALGDIFASLASKNAHVPYRNSKLTYLLQPCLGGQGKTLMFVNINPEPASAHESLCSLKFAAKVNGCETGAKGGARRHASGGGSSLLPSQMAAGEPKRFSLPGPPRTAGINGATTPRGTGSDALGATGNGPKRQSLYASTGGASSAKRPPPAGGCPPANAAKRARH
ncbi:kinesin motor domain-containing protein [Dunaliella salina]|uniref:Kinesin motor domain-containing protein n=1 Tax=Dunaliella salina TaxID=3046 RepID=A0ABQ7GNC9_DUNSA|nr:kinesin motor domain-containing protein [Dunaliella salina]|eukprot:KAF5836124.1 kinesin motor domain-containing protein [Dunaliella salina]